MALLVTLAAADRGYVADLPDASPAPPIFFWIIAHDDDDCFLPGGVDQTCMLLACVPSLPLWSVISLAARNLTCHQAG